MTDKEKTIYFAGIFDGEGSIGIYPVSNNVNSENKTYWAIKLAVCGIYKPMIESMWKHFSVGQLSTQKRQAKTQTPKGNVDSNLCRQSWRWTVTKKSEIEYVLDQIFPYLMEKHKQVDMSLLFCRGQIDGETAAKTLKIEKQFQFTVEDCSEPPRKSHRLFGEFNPNSRLTWKMAEEIRGLYKNENLNYCQLSLKFGVSKSALSRILNNKTYNVQPILNYSKPA